MTREIDDRPLWEQQLSESDQDVLDEWEFIQDTAQRHEQEWVALGMPRRHCMNCQFEKPLRSSGRCYACEKQWQRKGQERSIDLILKEIARSLK